MSKLASRQRRPILFLTGAFAALCLGAGLAPPLAADGPPNFAPDNATAWVPDRPTGDDFLPPASGPGPVMSVKAHPYVPNGGGRQPTYRFAHLPNPILHPRAIHWKRHTHYPGSPHNPPSITP